MPDVVVRDVGERGAKRKAEGNNHNEVEENKINEKYGIII